MFFYCLTDTTVLCDTNNFKVAAANTSSSQKDPHVVFIPFIFMTLLLSRCYCLTDWIPTSLSAFYYHPCHLDNGETVLNLCTSHQHHGYQSFEAGNFKSGLTAAPGIINRSLPPTSLPHLWNYFEFHPSGPHFTKHRIVILSPSVILVNHMYTLEHRSLHTVSKLLILVQLYSSVMTLDLSGDIHPNPGPKYLAVSV